MARIMFRKDGAAVEYGLSGGPTDGNHNIIDQPSVDAVISALLLVVMDEINTIRTLGLLGLTARTADDWKTKIAAKLP